MFQKIIYNTNRLNIIAHSRNSRNQTAYSSDNQLNIHSSPASMIQAVYHSGIGQAVHFQFDICRLPVHCILYFTIYQFIKTTSGVVWRRYQMLISLNFVIDFKKIMSFTYIISEFQMRSHLSQISINTESRFVEISGRYNAVIFYFSALNPFYHTYFAVLFESLYTKNKLYAF